MNWCHKNRDESYYLPFWMSCELLASFETSRDWRRPSSSERNWRGSVQSPHCTLSSCPRCGPFCCFLSVLIRERLLYFLSLPTHFPLYLICSRLLMQAQGVKCCVLCLYVFKAVLLSVLPNWVIWGLTCKMGRSNLGK